MLQPLLRGEDAHYQVRDWQNDPYGSSLGDWKTAQGAPLVIFEGVTSTRQAVADLLAYRIWVDAPEATRLARGLARDGEQAGPLWLAWMQQEQDFFTTDRTRERADLRVNGLTSMGADLDEDVVTTLDEPL